MFSKYLIKRKDKSSNPSVTVYNLLKTLDISATYAHVDKTLQEHPDFPSLLSLVESFPEWGVRTEAVKGEVKNLTKVDFPSIVYLKDKLIGEGFVVLESVHDDQAILIYPTEGRKSIRIDEFAKNWTGILLRAIPINNTGETNYKAHLKTQRLSRLRQILTVVGLPVLFLLAFGLGLTNVGMFSTLISLGLAKVLGLILCIVMVAASLGGQSIMDSLCPVGRVVNCQRVMQSPAGRMFGTSMAEWGMLYFAGGLLSLMTILFFGQVWNDLFLIGILGLLILPYTVFSIFYQAFVVRSWCWMCIVILGIFWFEFFILYEMTIPHFMSDLRSISFPFSLLLGFGTITISWISLRHILILANEAENFKTQVSRLRRNPDYIHAQIRKTAETDMGKMPFELEIGPADAKIGLTLVVNPICGYCWEVFDQMDQIINIGQGQIKAKIRFLVRKQDQIQNATEKKLDHEVSLRILAISEQGDQESAQNALRTWFAKDDLLSEGKFKRWLRQISLSYNHSYDKAESVLAEHLEWATRNMIVTTPTIFLGNNQIRNGLQLSDLKIFLMRQLAILESQ
jgi:uncharacterized membrane protein/protein-disulfide isomerase